MDEIPIRILLIDDELEFITFLANRLKLRGHLVATVTSGKEAIETASSERFDVAIVDLKMPGKDGLETLDQLKSLQPHLEVIMLTGHGSLDAALESGRRDALRFLSKPCDFNSLLVEILKAFEKKLQTQRQAYREDLELLMQEHLTPGEIVQATEELRRKYEQ